MVENPSTPKKPRGRRQAGEVQVWCGGWLCAMNSGKRGVILRTVGKLSRGCNAWGVGSAWHAKLYACIYSNEQVSVVHTYIDQHDAHTYDTNALCTYIYVYSACQGPVGTSVCQFYVVVVFRIAAFRNLALWNKKSLMNNCVCKTQDIRRSLKFWFWEYLKHRYQKSTSCPFILLVK